MGDDPYKIIVRTCNLCVIIIIPCTNVPTRESSLSLFSDTCFTIKKFVTSIILSLVSTRSGNDLLLFCTLMVLAAVTKKKGLAELQFVVLCKN